MRIPKTLAKQIKDKYDVVNETFISKWKEFETEVGDAKQPDFKPQLKVKRWDNEANFSVRLKEDNQETPTIKTTGNQITYDKSKYRARFYDKGFEEETGGFEFDVLLKEKPVSNVIEFTIQTKGLDFFYQPELTEEEKVRGHSQPENVIGSYAVYHQEQQGDYSKVGGKNYKTGKAFHVYRPQIIDANGKKVWGELSIDVEAGILTVTIPQDFYENGAYPMLVDPTFGYTTMGAGSWNYPANYMMGGKFTSPSDSNQIESISAGLKNSYDGAFNFKGVAVKASNKNIISNGVGAGTAVNTGTKSWFTSTFATPATIEASTDYYLCTIADKYQEIARDSGAGLFQDTTNSYSSPTNPTDGTYAGSVVLSIYATYTASSGGQPIAKRVQTVPFLGGSLRQRNF